MSPGRERKYVQSTEIDRQTKGKRWISLVPSEPLYLFMHGCNRANLATSVSIDGVLPTATELLTSEQHYHSTSVMTPTPTHHLSVFENMLHNASQIDMCVC